MVLYVEQSIKSQFFNTMSIKTSCFKTSRWIFYALCSCILQLLIHKQLATASRMAIGKKTQRSLNTLHLENNDAKTTTTTSGIRQSPDC